MNPAKWDAIAESFERGELVPANGIAAWTKQAADEAATIRRALPDSIDTLLEVGCGVGRLTPWLSLLFPRVIATDTSVRCLRLTNIACGHGMRWNVRTRAPDDPVCAEADAAVVWGNLYDEDWTREAANAHITSLANSYPIVLVQLAHRSELFDDWVSLDAIGIRRGDDWLRIQTR